MADVALLLFRDEQSPQGVLKAAATSKPVLVAGAIAISCGYLTAAALDLVSIPSFVDFVAR